jgi:meso-butanediol dehydrogenase / (S,S)-butanediol dehydrogenase / diacetyl reductase
MTAAAVRAEYVSLTPLGRIDEPEDVADVVPSSPPTAPAS